MNDILTINQVDSLKFNENDLIPVITQCHETKEVLMMAWMNKKAIELTIKFKKVTYFSRSRNKLWEKGETSGNYQILKKLITDCDKDTLLAIVEQKGVACHRGSKSCFTKMI